MNVDTSEFDPRVIIPPSLLTWIYAGVTESPSIFNALTDRSGFLSSIKTLELFPSNMSILSVGVNTVLKNLGISASVSLIISFISESSISAIVKTPIVLITDGASI